MTTATETTACVIFIHNLKGTRYRAHLPLTKVFRRLGE